MYDVLYLHQNFTDCVSNQSTYLFTGFSEKLSYVSILWLRQSSFSIGINSQAPEIKNGANASFSFKVKSFLN